ncbi:phosphatase PAP2 family protein [Geomonas sp. Red69]|uniref:Phosphatase PAP2 family protein n=1 Tax=Geomonas diazotrophica TaxID=2843197 RepID=A0ABX8JJL1_9BACT|nr:MULTISPECIES: phosphatase PAP2 family protein [Geomonas]MBU5636611.1 phosphatase PAP2 family protein [Geomonas diazotrophica]QWV98569.1 phosphatase PAP2 family protein [Geomonas nitrogeniifigens]QXE87752.1 phosphatase PAP2 family protein [Geomonas nitrogeniifigens]
MTRTGTVTGSTSPAQQSEPNLRTVSRRLLAGALPVLLLFWLAICQLVLVTPLYAAENVFTSVTAIKEEAGRFAGEGKLFLKGPVDPYLTGTFVTAGLFGLTYIFDEDIREEFSGSHHGVMRGITDAGNAVSNPLLHLGVAAAFYGTGAFTDQVKVMQLGEEMGEALLLADGATFVLKGVIGRGRPYQTDNNSSYRPFQFKDGYDSLPSMHTASSFALAHVAASKIDSFYGKAACYAAAGLGGFSRVYQGKHWASDVVLGAAIGELAGAAVTRYRSAPAGSVTVAPFSMDGAPAVALVGKF